ncbi:hypothetical protein F8388_021084 [Cannabis sativa]|uniref:Uncharacterized protein n=1 Tax=Cannabis sativa TaxID=3483 RepID=A0A7J6GZ34_CANSA|nr:hypothetical protein F8388_021084 [Cannabis sativa]
MVERDEQERNRVEKNAEEEEKPYSSDTISENKEKKIKERKKIDSTEFSLNNETIQLLSHSLYLFRYVFVTEKHRNRAWLVDCDKLMDWSFSHDHNWYCDNVIVNDDLPGSGSNNAHVNGHSNNGSYALPMKPESNSAPSSAGHSVDMQLHDPFSFQEVNIVPYGIGSKDTIDGIPRLSRVLSHKSKSTKSKQAAIAKRYHRMYNTFLSGKVSHKYVKDSTNWLFKLYYGNRMFMAYCCVACEVLYILLFLLAKNDSENLMNVLVSSAKQNALLVVLLGLSLFGWAVKQAVNVIQLKIVADVCVLYDVEKKHKP